MNKTAIQKAYISGHERTSQSGEEEYVRPHMDSRIDRVQTPSPQVSEQPQDSILTPFQQNILTGGKSAVAPPQPIQSPLDPQADYAQNGPRAASFKNWFGDWERAPKKASVVQDANRMPKTMFPAEGASLVDDGGQPTVIGDLHKHLPAFHFTENPNSAATEHADPKSVEVGRIPSQYRHPVLDHSLSALSQAGAPQPDPTQAQYFLQTGNLRMLYPERPGDPVWHGLVENAQGIVSQPVTSVYLNVRNPFHTDKKVPTGVTRQVIQSDPPLAHAFAQRAQQRGGKDWIPKATGMDLLNAFSDLKRTRDIPNVLGMMGHDGIVHPHNGPQGPEQRVIVFQPHQVKAQENVGTFDPGEADIYKAANPEEEHPWLTAAKERFGTTKRPVQAGYLLPNGEMLDFSDGQENERVRDHGEISGVMRSFGWEPKDDWIGRPAVKDFIGQTGAARVHFPYFGEAFVDFSTPLTDAQKNIIHSALHPGNGFSTDVYHPEHLYRIHSDYVENAHPGKAMLMLDKAGAKLRMALKKGEIAKAARRIGREEARRIGNRLKVDWSKVSLEQFRMGLEVEQEHANVTGGDIETTGKIALAHLDELPDYYTRLKKMEKAVNPQQHIHTPAFKNWFGDWHGAPHEASKVVRETGEPQETHHLEGHTQASGQKPLVVYHGSKNAGEIREFDPEKRNMSALYGPGYYFTEDPEVAGSYQDKGIKGHASDELYAMPEYHEGIKQIMAHLGQKYIVPANPSRKDVENHYYKNVKHLPKSQFDYYDKSEVELRQRINRQHFAPNSGVISAYLNIRNPAYIDKPMTEEIGNRLADVIEQHYEQQPLPSGSIPSDIMRRMGRDKQDIGYALGYIGNNVVAKYTDDSKKAYSPLSSKKHWPEFLERAGFDGITHIGGNMLGNKEHRVWIAFHPHQIKHVENEGTFDPQNPDMYKALRAIVIFKSALPAQEHEWERQAKEVFGTTTIPEHAGFILRDGTMLDFEGSNRGGRIHDGRSIHHGEIVRAMPGFDSEGDPDDNWNAVAPFMAKTGAVRCGYSPEVSWFGENSFFQMMHQPTPEQRAAIMQNHQRGIPVTVDALHPETEENIFSGRHDAALHSHLNSLLNHASAALQRTVKGLSVVQAAKQTDRNPTEAQKEAGNYRKGRFRWNGMEIAIENPKGSKRSGTDRNGKTWSVTMAHHYGYIAGEEAVDGDPVDVFIGPKPSAPFIYVIDQKAADGTFDEHKAMIGFADEEAAKKGYLACYSPGWDRLGAVTRLTARAFRAWIKGGGPKFPLSVVKSSTVLIRRVP